MVTGGAPIAGEVLEFLKIAFCCPIFEGYGLTETCGAATLSHIKDKTCGHVGGLSIICKLRLKDVPEMGYHATDDPPRGEICFKGMNIFKGYFRNPEKTKECFDQEGWFCTGDVGTILPNGAIKIIDRAKNIFKLSQGEYIAPEKLENIYVQSEYIMQIFVHGDSLQTYLVAVVVIEPEKVKGWLKMMGIRM